MLYRFRSTGRLLTDGELENHYFYFASPSQQNDPMEGYVDYFWKGDYIAWLGLFKHYAWQVFMTMLTIPLKPEVADLYKLHLAQTEIHVKETRLPELRTQIEKVISSDRHITNLATVLGKSEKEFSGSELQMLLLFPHKLALHYAYQTLQKIGIELFLNPKNIEHLFAIEVAHRGIDDVSMIIEREGENFSAICDVANHAFDSVKLISQINAIQSACPADYKTTVFLFADFCENYVRQVPRLSYPDWYCVCFNTDISNPALWGYYADGHKGVCLVFKNEPKDGMRLTEMQNGGRVDHFPIHKVNYGTAPVRVDFFRSLGRLFGDERSHWLMHEGAKSQVLIDIFSQETAWRDEFYSTNTNRLLIKSSAWEEEKEYRMVLDDMWENHNEARKFSYEFSDLDGIVFGIKTPTAEKVRIIETVRSLCQAGQRDTFNFYQAVYNTASNKIEPKRINYLKMLP